MSVCLAQSLFGVACRSWFVFLSLQALGFAVGALDRKEDGQLTRRGRRSRFLRSRMPRVPNRVVLTRGVASHWFVCLHRAAIGSRTLLRLPVLAPRLIFFPGFISRCCWRKPCVFVTHHLPPAQSTHYFSNYSCFSCERHHTLNLRPFMRVTFGASQSWGMPALHLPLSLFGRQIVPSQLWICSLP